MKGWRHTKRYQYAGYEDHFWYNKEKKISIRLESRPIEGRPRAREFSLQLLKGAEYPGFSWGSEKIVLRDFIRGRSKDLNKASEFAEAIMRLDVLI